MLVQRLFYGSLLIAGLVLIFWGDYVFANVRIDPNETADLRCGSIIPLVVLLLAVFGTLETLNLARAAGYAPMGKVVLIGVVVLNIIPWLVPAVVTDARQCAFGWELIVFMLATLAGGV
ncbi:MAG: hypothetical protein IH895_07595, partial [Planctomycetes bacterium]|nr:hypothetical protein [Planctomycetota bacterium]